MLKIKQMQEIQDLKLRGYSINEIVKYYAQKGRKTPTLPTIRKYYNMPEVPKTPNQNLVKDKVFDHEPFRSAIIEIICKNSKKIYMSSIYDVLIERFVEGGFCRALPGNEQTLRNYVHYLSESGILEQEHEEKRTYDYVFDVPPGEQMLIDFGQVRFTPGVVIHFICLLLRYSRMLHVFAQDHKFNAEEASRAIYRCFCKLGGRPTQLVIDQDAVFVSDETYGEVIKTRVFDDFCAEQDLKLWVCRKADPESKGPIENAVGFVKKNYFSARNITCIDDVLKSLPGWVERKNNRLHMATFRVPSEIFESIEQKTLRPLIPSLYENSPSSFVPVDINSIPYIQYKSSKYSVGADYCFSKIHYKAVGGKLHIYDADLKYLCTHNISECRGSIIRLEEHRRRPSADWLSAVENLRQKWNCPSFQDFIGGFRQQNKRYLYNQLSAVSRLLDEQKPERGLVSSVMEACCRERRFRYSQFKATYEVMKAKCYTPATAQLHDIQHQDLDIYQQAFMDRCDSGGR